MKRGSGVFFFSERGRESLLLFSGDAGRCCPTHNSGRPANIRPPTVLTGSIVESCTFRFFVFFFLRYFDLKGEKSILNPRTRTHPPTHSHVYPRVHTHASLCYTPGKNVV